jgi:hypothetical protein
MSGSEGKYVTTREEEEEDKLNSKLRELIGSKQLIHDELELQRQRMDLVRLRGEHLIKLTDAQTRALEMQNKLMRTYTGLCGGEMDNVGVTTFKQNILFIVSGSVPAAEVEQAVALPESEVFCE